MPTSEPTDAEMLREAMESRILDLHVCLPGKVEKYNAVKQTADVLPVVKKPTHDGEGTRIFDEYPAIQNVPVVWPRAGGYSMHFPMAPGDHVVLVFSELDPSQWRGTGQVSKPAWLELHGLSFPYAIPGIAPNSGALAATDAPGAGEAVINGPDVVRIGGPTADFVALATKVDANFQAIKTMFDTWVTAPNDGGAALKTLSGTLVLNGVGSVKLKGE